MRGGGNGSGRQGFWGYRGGRPLGGRGISASSRAPRATWSPKDASRSRELGRRIPLPTGASRLSLSGRNPSPGSPAPSSETRLSSWRRQKRPLGTWKRHKVLGL